MTTPAEDIKDLLSRDLGFVEGKDLYIGLEPAAPDAVVTLFDIHGRVSQLVYDPQYQLERPSIQIRVRGLKYKETWERLRKVVVYLESAYNITINNSRYLMFYLDWGLGLLDQDMNNRWRFYCNVETKRTEAS
jgi:hypothetical protein